MHILIKGVRHTCTGLAWTTTMHKYFVWCRSHCTLKQAGMLVWPAQTSSVGCDLRTTTCCACVHACVHTGQHTLRAIVCVAGVGAVCCGEQAYESGEKQDTEKLAKELDGLEGGRSVDATAVKACVPDTPHPLLISRSLLRTLVTRLVFLGGGRREREREA